MNSRTSNFLFRKLSMLLVTLSLSGMLAFAQNRTVTGTVVDANGEPIPGANVIIVGTQVGATTDFDGNFSIPNVSKNAALQVSFIGYATQRVDIAGQSQVRISLAEDRDLLDEVVVIGYGAVRRRDLTGAVASVKGDNVKQTPVANVAEALQGRLPGVNVISEDGRPGATQSIRVRGGGSITQSNDPLFVVDGLPVGNINDIPASEIESIDVLKDASATAIYGSRGANGVILVTTKGSKEGKVRISYDGFAQAKTVPNTQATLNAQEYVLHNWSYAASRGTANADAVAKYFGLGSQYGNHYAQYASHKYSYDMNSVLSVNTSASDYQTWTSAFKKAVPYKRYSAKWMTEYNQLANEMNYFPVSDENCGCVSMFFPSVSYASTSPKWNKAIQKYQWNNVIHWEQYGW